MLDHPTALLGPPKGPILAQKGPFGGPGQLLGPELVPTATGQSSLVGCIHIMCLDPGAQKSPFLAKKYSHKRKFGAIGVVTFFTVFSSWAILTGA